MTKVKYIIKNGDYCLGEVWESNNKEVIVLRDDKVAIDYPVELLDTNGKPVKEVNLMDLLTSALVF